MNEELIAEINRLINDAEELGERPVVIEHYKTLLNYYVTCLDVLACEIIHANQQLSQQKTSERRNRHF